MSATARPSDELKPPGEEEGAGRAAGAGSAAGRRRAAGGRRRRARGGARLGRGGGGGGREIFVGYRGGVWVATPSVPVGRFSGEKPPPPPTPPSSRSRRSAARAVAVLSAPAGRWVPMQGARVSLKGWQQAAVAFGSAFGALLDPRRADLIAALGETTGKPAFQRVLQRMKNSAEGREVLLDRPRVISSQVAHAWDMPENTFGAAYAQFMGSRNFSPDDRPPVRFMDTDELAYVATRAREVHDFWHVLFGLPTNLIGETALKVIEFEQMFLPMCMLSVVGGSARFNEKQRSLFFQHYFPWASKAGLKCTDLMSVYYEKHFHEDLEDVRRNWGIHPCPDPKKSSA